MFDKSVYEFKDQTVSEIILTNIFNSRWSHLVGRLHHQDEGEPEGHLLHHRWEQGAGPELRVRRKSRQEGFRGKEIRTNKLIKLIWKPRLLIFKHFKFK